MLKMLKRGTIAAAACGAGAIVLGAVLLGVGAFRPASPAVYGPPVNVPGSGTGGGGTAVLDGGREIDPSQFSTGACIEYPPTSGDRHETVFLDAGHGGIDPGGVGETQAGATVEESTVNLAIELDATAVLRAQGYTVVDSRTQNTTVLKLGPGDTDGNLLTAQGSHDDVAARDVCANMAKAKVLVGIYMDAGAPGNAGSLTGYDPARPFAGQNQRLATLVQNDVLAAMNAQDWGIPDDGVQSDTGLGSAIGTAAQNYGHLLLLGPAEAGYFETPSQMPGALIEPLFLTDPFEGSIAASASDQQVIANGLVKAIGQYFG